MSGGASDRRISKTPEEKAVSSDSEAESESETEARFLELGNYALKAGLVKKAQELFSEAVTSREPLWPAALSNRALCHLQLKQYDNAIADAATAIAERPKYWHAYFVKCSAHVEKNEWLEVFQIVRYLRSVQDDLPEKMQEKLRTCEEKWRGLRTYSSARGWPVNSDDPSANPTFLLLAGVCAALVVGAAWTLWRRTFGSFTIKFAAVAATVILGHLGYSWAVLSAQRSETFTGTVRMVLDRLGRDPSALRTIHVISTSRAELCQVAAPEFQHLLRGAVARVAMWGPQAPRDPETGEPLRQVVLDQGRELHVHHHEGPYHLAPTALHPRPDLALLFGADLAKDYDHWAPTLLHLADSNVLTVVTGYNRDQSLTQNEDIVEALSGAVVLPTMKNPHHHYVIGRHVRNYHVFAFQGKSPASRRKHEWQQSIQGVKHELKSRLYDFPPDSTDASSRIKNHDR